jgi:hypothetical protein
MLRYSTTKAQRTHKEHLNSYPICFLTTRHYDTRKLRSKSSYYYNILCEFFVPFVSLWWAVRSRIDSQSHNMHPRSEINLLLPPLHKEMQLILACTRQRTRRQRGFASLWPAAWTWTTPSRPPATTVWCHIDHNHEKIAPDAAPPSQKRASCRRVTQSMPCGAISLQKSCCGCRIYSRPIV